MPSINAALTKTLHDTSHCSWFSGPGTSLEIHVPFMPGIQVRNLFARIDFRPKGVQTAMST